MTEKKNLLCEDNSGRKLRLRGFLVWLRTCLAVVLVEVPLLQHLVAVRADNLLVGLNKDGYMLDVCVISVFNQISC